MYHAMWRLLKEFIKRPSWWFYGWLNEMDVVHRIIREEIEREE